MSIEKQELEVLKEALKEIEALKEKEIEEKYEAYINSDPPDDIISSYDCFKAGYLMAQPASGNQYTGYLKEGNESLKKVHPDEPIFILRGQDITAPGIILKWMEKNLDTVPETKLKEAYHTAIAMTKYHSRRNPT